MMDFTEHLITKEARLSAATRVHWIFPQDSICCSQGQGYAGGTVLAKLDFFSIGRG